MELCLADNTTHESLAALHKHLRTLKLKKEDYYVKYHDRRDLFTGLPIPFKTPEQYLSAEFSSKETLKKWIDNNPIKGREWAVKWLKKRKDEKELVYPPTQVELRSLLCPSMHYYNRVGGYNQICKELGYKIRFDGSFFSSNVEVSNFITDTREQNPLLLGGGIKQKLNVGDYGLVPPYDIGVYIERKNLSDFVGTMSLGYERFVKEVERANEIGAYLIILVEAPLEQALDFKLKHVKTNAAHVFKNLRGLLSSFGNVQALFVNNRLEATNAVLKLLRGMTSVKEVDLQYLYECGKLRFDD